MKRSPWKPRIHRAVWAYFAFVAALVGILMWWSADFRLKSVWVFFAATAVIMLFLYIGTVQREYEYRTEWAGKKKCPTCNGTGKVAR